RPDRLSGVRRPDRGGPAGRRGGRRLQGRLDPARPLPAGRGPGGRAEGRPPDLVVNPGYGRLPGNYAGLVPEGVRVLAGPAFALVRPEFAAHRDAALKRRREGGHLKHLL